MRFTTYINIIFFELHYKMVEYDIKMNEMMSTHSNTLLHMNYQFMESGTTSLRSFKYKFYNLMTRSRWKYNLPFNINI